MVRATLTDATAPERFLRKPGGSGLEGGVRLGAGDRVRDLLFGRERHVQRDLGTRSESVSIAARTECGWRLRTWGGMMSMLGVTEYRDLSPKKEVSRRRELRVGGVELRRELTSGTCTCRGREVRVRRRGGPFVRFGDWKDCGVLLDCLIEAQAFFLGDRVLPRSASGVSGRMAGDRVGNGSPS